MRAISRISAAFAACAAMATAASGVRADTLVYHNDFESNTVGTTAAGVTTTGFTAAGTLGGRTLTGATLNLHDPSDPAAANNTNWLGMLSDMDGKPATPDVPVALGSNVAKVAGGDDDKDINNEIVRLSLSNLIEGATYSVQFDLLVKNSWDGTSPGPDFWYFSANGTRLVNTVFDNVGNRQSYTDTHYDSGATLPPSPPVPAGGTGADAKYQVPFTDFANQYAIYYFGHGTGNPTLSFVAGLSGSVTLEWGRYSGSTDSADESWALDNVRVSTNAAAPVSVPLPAALPGGAACLAGLLLANRLTAGRRRRAGIEC